jgi:gluconolactonase
MRCARVAARRALAVGALAAAALAAAFALNPLLGGDATLPEKKEPAPGARIEILDPAMNALLAPGAAVRLLGDAFQFTEGPAWLPWEGGVLVFSDIPADTLYRWTETAGLAVFRKPSHNANGNTTDPEGRLVTCEHGSRTVTRTAPDGTVVTLASAYKGKKLNSPNDVVVRSDGTVWFTDPPYGIKPAEQEQPANYVFRLDPGAAEPVAVADDFIRPNGLCFSPDEKFLYVADSDRSHIRRFRVTGPGAPGLAEGEVFAKIQPTGPDGIRCDADGRLYVTAGDGVHILGPDARLLGKIRLPVQPANCTFGGPDRRTLFITARTHLYAVTLAVRGSR